MIFKKLLSLFLAVLMLCGALTWLSVVTVSADEAGDQAASDSTDGEEVEIENTEEAKIAYYHNTKFAKPGDKIKTMKMWSTNGDYTIYADQRSGEVAIKDEATGQILFTNPYDIGYSNATENIKNTLMSQIIVSFARIGSDQNEEYTSFLEAAVKDQIKIRNIKGGIRVEYTIGRENARYLAPRWISAERFEEYILAPMEEKFGVTLEEAQIIRDQYDHPLNENAFKLCKWIEGYYQLKSLSTASSESYKQDLLETYPILEQMDIYVIEATMSENELAKLEEAIKTNCTNYSYEEMDYDHQMTGYEDKDSNPPLFKMALEYTLADDGFEVRLPANGLRFNESLFEVRNIEVLPYLGAGNNGGTQSDGYEGYAFFPDGSGALLSLQDMKVKSPTGESIAVKIYGEDYAYHELEQKYQQVARFPVYGIVENTRYYDYTRYDDVREEETVTTISGVVYDIVQKHITDGTIGSAPDEIKAAKALMDNATDVKERIEKRGFAAFVVEGEALSSLAYSHDGIRDEYDAIALVCNPRPRDEYNLADAISVGNNTKVSVVSDRKYVGSYRIHVSMLSDETLAENAKLGPDDWYEASWLGMGVAYRNYLIEKGALTALDANSISEDIPLYIESFGAMETIEKFLSIPREVTRPLTSAENVYTMYEELAAEGVANINFKLTGYANGGMYSKVPYKLKWEKAVSEGMSMQELFDKAYASKQPANGDEKTVDGEFTIFPDFDFAYMVSSGMFDGFSMRKHAVRTIDDRYAYKREYMATQQRYAGYYQLAISPAYFDRFYTKLMGEYLKYDNVEGISVGSLGTALNSDFDEDEPYNREDAKGFVTTALEFISNPDNNLEVMVDGGNAYTWKYVDHILGASLDSSRYLAASYSVPFVGVVLHGYMNFTGSPLNMEGDVNYAKLKAIENGASIYFTLSYQNTQNLKEDFFLSKYYSVRYDIWFDDVVEIYNELNNELADVQTMPIIGHSFLSGVRVPDTDELDRDLEAEFNEMMNTLGNQQAILDKKNKDAVADARLLLSTLSDTVKDKIKSSTGFYAGGTGAAGAASQYLKGNTSFLTALTNYRAAEKAYQEIRATYPDDHQDVTAASETLEKAEKKLLQAVSNMAKNIIKIRNAVDEIDTLMSEEIDPLTGEKIGLAARALDTILKADCPENIKVEAQEMYDEALKYMSEDMGMDYIYTTSNLELQTFMEIQFLLAVDSLQGTENFAGEKNVDQLKMKYEAIANDNFGLVDDPATYVFLRYLEANKGKSNEELAAEYGFQGLKDGQTSIPGLIRFVRQLLGIETGRVQFDPILTDEQIDNEIKNYIKNQYLVTLSQGEQKNFGKNDKDGVTLALKYLNINPYQYGSSLNVNNVNIMDVLSKINVKLTGGTGPVALMNKVTTGDYDLSSVYTEEQMSALVEEIKKILKDQDYTVLGPEIDACTAEIEALTAEIDGYKKQIAEIDANETLSDEEKAAQKEAINEKNTAAETAKKAAEEKKKGFKPIEYQDAATMDTDIRNYISAFYYAKVIAKVAPSTSNALPLLHAKSNTTESLQLLFNSRVETYGIDKTAKGHKYDQYVDAYLADLSYVRGEIAKINDQIDEYYGDVQAELEYNYFIIFANYVLKAGTAPGKLDVADADEKTQLNTDAEALVSAITTATTLEEAKAMVNQVIALFEGLTLKEDYDYEAASAAYVYQPYLKQLTAAVVDNVTVHRYYYDENVAQMDAYILSVVDQKKAQIEARLDENTSVVDYVGIVLDVLSDPEASANSVIETATSMISYTPASSKRSIRDDVTEYYLYQLLNSVRSANLGKASGYELSLLDRMGKPVTDTSNAMTALKNLMSERNPSLINAAKSAAAAGEMPNYSLDVVLGAEMDALVNEIYNEMIELDYRFDTNADYKAQLENLIKFYFYEEVFKRLNCTKAIEFNLHEIYDGTLEESYVNLKALIKYFTLSFTDVTEEEFETYFVAQNIDTDDDEEEEESRYISDDGRIVSVTYGQKKEGGGYTPYKTFILNYNNFSVKVEYEIGEGETIIYTIPAYGYVTVIDEAQ